MTRTGHFLEAPALASYDTAASVHDLRFALAMAGRTFPCVARVLDLSPQAGLAALIDAASNQHIEWHARPLAASPPLQVLARAVDLPNLRLSEETASGGETGRYDVVSLLDGWSFQPPEAQRRTLEIAAGSLSDGGALRLAHAALPGQAGTAVLHRLVAAGLAHGSTDRWCDPAALRAAVEETLRILDVNPAGAGHGWGDRAAMERWLDGSSGNTFRTSGLRCWRPSYFRDVAAMMADVGLAWVCPLEATDGIDSLHLPRRQQALLGGISDTARREEVRDVLLNTRLRRDLWQRQQSRQPIALETIADDIRFVLAAPVGAFDFEANGSLGRVALARECYGPLLARLGSMLPATFRELAGEVAGRMSLREVGEALAILLDRKAVATVQQCRARIERSVPTSHALNAAIVQRACEDLRITHLASPVTGCGIEVSPLHQVFMAACLAGEKAPEDWARFASAAAARVPALAVGANDFAREAEAFGATHLPIYRALRLVG